MHIASGEKFRQFRVIDRVGEGGMGVVYRAHDEQLGRDVALKFLIHAGQATPDVVARLRREARSLAALRHPNIVAIHDIGEDAGVPFLVLEWIDGHPLDHATVARPMPLDDFLPLATDIATALGFAHENGIVHRDLKPANVLLTPGGRAKLLDFGVAKVAAPDAALTASGTAVGTLSYMSPEQASGESVGPPSDIFAFGTLAYQLLTGELPFTGAGAGPIIYAIIAGKHPPLAGRRPDLPAELIALIEQCLAADPEHRFADGNALAAALDGLGAVARPRTPSPGVSDPASTRVRFEQSIRFCRTSDGVRIAYSVVGEGPTLVRVLGHFTHLEMEWEWPDLRRLWEQLGRRNTVVRYDGRGIGLSDPWTDEFTEATRQLDLDAVVEAVGAEQVALLGISEGGWTAASYANAHPERVASLILYGSYCHGARARASYDPEEDAALVTLIRKGWGRDSPAFRQLFTAQFFQDDAAPQLLAHFNDLQRASADADTAARYHASCHRRGDGEAMFAAIRVPTLVVHGKQDMVTDVSEGRFLASVIPGARLVLLSTYGHYFPVDGPGVSRVVDAFNQLLHPS